VEKRQESKVVKKKVRGLWLLLMMRKRQKNENVLKKKKGILHLCGDRVRVQAKGEKV
jgi:hypothetical protein